MGFIAIIPLRGISALVTRVCTEDYNRMIQHLERVFSFMAFLEGSTTSSMMHAFSNIENV